MIPVLKFQLRQEATTKLANLTQDFLSTLASDQSAVANWQTVAHDLRDCVVESVRSISHELWEQKPHKSLPDLTPLVIAQVLVSRILLRKDINAELESKIEPLKVVVLSTELLMLRFSKEIAKYLHGSLQSRLIASAFAIEVAGRADDLTSLSAEIEKARQSIATPFDEFQVESFSSLEVELQKLINVWMGILSPTLSIVGVDSEGDPTRNRNMVHVIEEAFSNGLRHGLATRAHVIVVQVENGTSVTVIDDGIGPRTGTPGLGSALFNSIAGKSWSLTRGPDGIGAQLNLLILDT